MTQLTELQFKALNHYAHCEMNASNGATPTCIEDLGTYLWADIAATALGISDQAMGGVLTSLTQAGLAVIQAPGRGDPDGLFNFTDRGFAAWQREHSQ